MRISLLSNVLFAVLFSSSLISAHGDESPEALAKRNEFTAQARRSLSACSAKLRERGLHAARIEKREDLVERHFGEAKRKHKKRQLTKDYDVSKLYNTEKQPGSCILAPEETIGPYFLSTHLFRGDMRGTPMQKGVEFLLTLQFVDVNTCNPIQGVTSEFWHANYKGVYSGFEAEGTLGQDFHRGMQTTDKDGIVQMVTFFPGWYSGRALHVHIATHLNGSLVPNDQEVGSAKKGAGKFYTGGTVPHIGQLFFQEDFLSQLEKTAPYTEHTNVTRLKNEEDNIYSGSGSSVQIMNVRFIEEGKVESGIVGDAIIGIDTSKNYTAQASSPTGGSPPGGGAGPGSATGSATLSATATGTATGTAGTTAQTGEALKLAVGQIPMAVAMGMGWILGN